jgi:hypothetical protein
MPVIRSPSNYHCSLWFPYECGGGHVLSRPRLRTLPPPHSYGNQRLQRQFDGLLMMVIIMPETCWAVSVRQNNKILLLIVASSWVFYLSDWRCTEPQTLNTIKVSTWTRRIINKRLLEELGTMNLFKRYAFYKRRINMVKRERGESTFWQKGDRNFKRNLSKKLNRQI